MFSNRNVKEENKCIVPGHFLTMPSNFASPQVPLQHGRKVQCGNSDPQAKQLDCIKLHNDF